MCAQLFRTQGDFTVAKPGLWVGLVLSFFAIVSTAQGADQALVSQLAGPSGAKASLLQRPLSLVGGNCSKCDRYLDAQPQPARVQFVAFVKASTSDLKQQKSMRIEPTELKMGALSYFKSSDLIVAVLPRPMPEGGVEFIFRLDEKANGTWKNLGTAKFHTQVGERAHIITPGRLADSGKDSWGNVLFDIRFKTASGSEKPSDVVPRARTLQVPDRTQLSPLRPMGTQGGLL